MMGLSDKLLEFMVKWLTEEPSARNGMPLSDYDRLRYEIRFCDVLLVEGRSRVSGIIQSLTLSPWTHAAIYIGQLHTIDDPQLREKILNHYPAKPEEQLIIEALLGQGTIVAPLAKYRNDHVRICRPTAISRKDAQTVVAHAAGRLGTQYDIRHLLDLARFFFPYRLLPRHWRSSLFGKTQTAKTVCSTMLAEAFSSARFPVRPILQRTEDGRLKVSNRNPKLYTPNDFDFSPYFDIIKYPIFGVESAETYRNLPWNEHGVVVKNESFAEDCVAAKEELIDNTEFRLAQEAREMLEDINPERD
ncbi:MAG TPA: YiiX/YebB-like N1pC/P60 family cysteine hydrolase [Gammaproteobacteria bacterium]